MSNIRFAKNKSLKDELTAEFDNQNPEILDARFFIENKVDFNCSNPCLKVEL